MKKKEAPNLVERLTQYCEGCLPADHGGRLVKLEFPDSRLMLHCKMCKKPADWMVIRK